MDNNRKDSSNLSYGMRRVNVKQNQRRRSMETKDSDITYNFEIRRKMEQSQKRERQREKRLRAAAVVAAAAILAVILLFMTPIFNITEIRVEGNEVVEIQTIKDKIGDLIGTNLFAVRKSLIKSRLLEISKINDAQVAKNIVPPSIIVTIKETKPAAYMIAGNNKIFVDSELKVIDDSNTYDMDSLPSVSGISVSDYKLNTILMSNSEEKDKILKEMLQLLESVGMLAKTTYISVDDLTDIKFNYDNRLEVVCGSHLDMTRKIKMFSAAINSSAISDNSIGTMNLSNPGEIIYDP